MSCCWLCTVSLCIIVMMEDDLELASSWCQIGYLNNLCFSLLILLRNDSVLGVNIWISLFKSIKNENFEFNINCALEQTHGHSLNPPFFGTPCIWNVSPPWQDPFKDISVKWWIYPSRLILISDLTFTFSLILPWHSKEFQ